MQTINPEKEEEVFLMVSNVNLTIFTFEFILSWVEKRVSYDCTREYLRASNVLYIRNVLIKSHWLDLKPNAKFSHVADMQN